MYNAFEETADIAALEAIVKLCHRDSPNLVKADWHPDKDIPGIYPTDELVEKYLPAVEEQAKTELVRLLDQYFGIEEE